MDILGTQFVLLSADGPIIGGDPSTIKSGESAGAPAGTETATGTPTGTEDTAAAQNPPDSLASFFSGIFIWVAMFAAMYFLLIRPQRKQAKEMRILQEELKTGENVVTSSGMFGKIVGVGQDSFLVEFGENKGVRIWIRKSDIIGIKTPQTTPLPADAIEDKKGK